MIFKKILLIMIMILSVACVQASSEFLDWGFGNRIINLGSKSELWASNLPEGSFAGVNKTIAVDSVGLPLVTDLDKDGTNEIFIFSSSSVFMYNNFADLVSSYSPVGGLFARYTAVKEAGRTTVGVIGLVNDSGDFTLHILNKTGESLTLERVINISDRNYEGNVYVGTYGKILIPDDSFNATIYDLSDDSEDYFTHFALGNVTYPANLILMIDTNHVLFADYNVDGVSEYVALGQCSPNPLTSGSCPCFGIMNSDTGVWSGKGSPFAGEVGCNTISSLSMGAGSIGSASTVQSFILSGFGSTKHMQIVLDISGGERYAFSEVSGNKVSHPTIGDIDADGFNEYCYYQFVSNRYTCLDSSFTTKYTLNATQTTNHIPSIGRYIQTGVFKDTQQILSGNGIFAWDNVGATTVRNMTKVATLNNEYVNIPVVVQDQTNFVKDLIQYSPDNIIVSFSDQVIATCGNGLCEPAENALNCFADCGSTDPTQGVLTDVQINPCHTQPWLVNTSVKVTAKVETLDDSLVQAKASLYSGTASIQELNWTPLSVSGTTFTFVFVANTTINNGDLTVFARTEDNLDQNILSFSIDVADIGISFGDSSCGIVQPLEEIVIPEDIESDVEDNAILNALLIFSGFTGLSPAVLYFVAMFIILLIFIGFSALARWDGMWVAFLGGLLVIIMLIIGAFLQIVHIGIILTMILLALLVGSLIIRKAVTGG